MLNDSSARVLWWACEQQLWALSDLFRLAYATKLLSGGDHMLLHSLVDQLEHLVKANKEGARDAI